MIDLENMASAYNDVMGTGPEEEGSGYSLEEMLMRFEMVGIDFDDFRAFLTGRLQLIDEVIDLDEHFSKGYIHAAMEFVLYGVLMGKEAALDMEIKNDDKD